MDGCGPVHRKPIKQGMALFSAAGTEITLYFYFCKKSGKKSVIIMGTKYKANTGFGDRLSKKPRTGISLELRCVPAPPGSEVRLLLILLAFRSEEERDKFEYLFERYQNLMLYKAREILHDAMLAEDAVSEALIRLYKNIHKIEDVESPQAVAFLMTIVKNVALTMLSKEKKTVLEPFPETLADSFNLETQIVAELSEARIYALLDNLNEDLKSVFVLKFAYDLPHKEIGRLLNISENNVTVRLHRAKQKLSTLLQKEGCV